MDRVPRAEGIARCRRPRKSRYRRIRRFAPRVPEKKDGKGTYYYSNGKKLYVGTFKNDLIHGKGIYYNKNGKKSYQGSYKKNLKEGKGTLYHKNGEKLYEGILQNIRKLNLPLIMVRSKSGCAHIFLFIKKFIPAEEIKFVMNVFAAQLGIADKMDRIYPR